MPRTKTSDLEKSEITKNIKKALKNSHITRNKLIELTGISENTIDSYFKGRRCPSLENAKIIAEKTGSNYMEFLSTEQRKREKTEKRGTFIEKNKVYVSLLRSAGFRFEVISDDELEMKCNISSRTMRPYNDAHAEILQTMREYRSGLRPELSDDDYMNLHEQEIYFAELATAQMFLDSESWAGLKKEILGSVKGIVQKHIDAAVKEREMQKKEQTTQMITSDLLKTINAVNAVLPALSGETSGAIDPKALETLKQVSERYKH